MTILTILVFQKKMPKKRIHKDRFIGTGIGSIHETEIKQFGDRNDRNRIEIISTLSHKSQIVETNYEGRKSKRITRVETDYESRKSK